MKFSAITLIAAAAGLAAAKTLEDYVPKCSQQCLKDAQSSATDCKEGDLPCFCILENYHNIYDAGVSCVLLKCGNDVAVGKFSLAPFLPLPFLRQVSSYGFFFL